MNFPAGDLMQWDQPVENPSVKWRHPASTPCVDANASTGSVFTLVDVHRVETSDGTFIDVLVNYLGECLPTMSIFVNHGCCPRSFDASRFRHGMRLSGHLAEIYLGGEPRLSCERCWMKR